MRLPDFLIIGAAKSGTTNLYKHLDRHPQIYLFPQKEPQFFAVDAKFAQGLEWYSSLFEAAKPQQICGEASTDYTKLPRFPKSAERIAEVLPDVKMIYVMRHPVERAYSYYVHLQRGKIITETFEEFNQRTNICLDASFYMKQINHFLQFFPRESFLFLLMDDVANQPVSTLQKVCQFLNVDEDVNLCEVEEKIANKGESFFQNTIRGKITAPILKIPGIDHLKRLVPRSLRNRIFEVLENSDYGKSIIEQYKAAPMLPETRQELLDKFRQPNQELMDFLQRDLSHWDI